MSRPGKLRLEPHDQSIDDVNVDSRIPLPRPVRAFVSLAPKVAVAGSMIGAIVLVGYAFGWTWTWRPLEQGPATHPWTAVSFVILGFAALVAHPRRRSFASALLASIAGTIVAGWAGTAAVGGPDIFQTLTPFAPTLAREAFHGHPIAMGGNTALTIALSAAAIILLYARREIASQAMAFAATLPPTVALTGYIYGTPGFYGAMALPTLTAGLLCAFAIMCRTAYSPPLRHFLNPGARGRIIRLQASGLLGSCFGLGLVASRFQFELGSKALAIEVVALAAIIVCILADVTYYSEQLRRRLSQSAGNEEPALSRALEGAGERGEISLVYQPQINLVTGQVFGVEALARWCHPVHGEVPPVTFIPLAEASGQIVALGDWILGVACRQAVKWHGSMLADVKISVNVSPVQLNDARFVESVMQVLQVSGLPPERLVLEVTEGAMVKREDRGFQALCELRDAGVHIALDDFGTGYSSLSYLQELPCSYLKIDQSFVRDLPDERRSKAITSAIVAMGRSLGMTIVAEGIEASEQADFLQSICCDIGQGYLYAHPMETGDLLAWSETNSLHMEYDANPAFNRPHGFSNIPNLVQFSVDNKS